MNSLCIHVADMKLTTFSNKTQHFATHSLGLACRRRPRPTTISGKSSTPMERSSSVDTHEVLTGSPR
jgi:hypothetical protein